MIPRDATTSDDSALASFDPGSGSSWLDEVVEIVAVRHDRQRLGLARMVTEAVIADRQAGGVQSVSRLVHPGNSAPIGFSRRVFPDAEKWSPPDDDPYLRFVLGH